MRARIFALALAGIVFGTAASYGRAAPPGSVAAVRAYLAAMNRHNPGAICATFAPALRTYEARFDAGTPHPVSCRAAVAENLTPYGDERWRSARIVRIRSVSVDRRGIAAVVLALDHHYVCVPPYFSPDAPCKTRTIRRPDVVYLTRVSGAWKVLKPGLVFRAAGISAPYDSESDWYPPGDSRTVRRPVHGVGAGFRCPPTRAVASGHDRIDVQSGPAAAPWLSIRRFAVSEMSNGRACFALRLAAPPRPDSSYQLGVGRVGQAAVVEGYSVEFDGVGGIHVLLGGVGRFGDPSVARYLPRVALHGTELDVLAPHWAHLRGRYLAAAQTASLQLDEPLLRNPLDASDDGLPYGACLVVPTGRLDRAGNCGEVPGP